MVKCPVCGNENPDDARFCAMCGEPLEVEVSEEPTAEIQWDGEGYCPLCRKRVRTFMGRCEFCGEPVSSGPQPPAAQHSQVQVTQAQPSMQPASPPAAQPSPPGVDMNAVAAAVQQVLAGMGMQPSTASPEFIQQVTAQVMSQMSSQPQQPVATAPPQNPPPQPAPAVSPAKPQAEVHHARESLRMGEKTKSLEKQKECFICLGTIGVDEEPVICPGCQLAYHRECAADVGVCPNCGHVFNL